MNLTDAPLGYAFEGDYPESYGKIAEKLQWLVQEQIDELDRAGSPERAAGVLGILRGRRCGREDLPQLDIRPRRDGADCLLARGEIVLSSSDYAIPDVQHMFKSRGFDRCDDRVGDYVRLRQPTVSHSDVERALDECACYGVLAWPNYIASMAAVGKGIGGAQPVAGLGKFSRYGLPSGGTPVMVAVIDTGIPRNKRARDGWLDAIERSSDNIDELDVLPAGPDGYLDFQAGHGTFVAGIVQRVAPGAHIRAYRAADTDGFATDDSIASAMLEAFGDGAVIINLSLAGRTVDNQSPRATAEAVDRIRRESKGEAVIVAAAGNYGDDAPCWPAALEGVESVAGLTARLTPARWSSYSGVRFAAVAEGVRSTFVPGRESPVFDRNPEVFPDDAWALWSGTSFSAAQISGALARICQETGMTARQAADTLDRRGKPIAGFGSAMRILEGVR